MSREQILSKAEQSIELLSSFAVGGESDAGFLEETFERSFERTGPSAPATPSSLIQQGFLHVKVNLPDKSSFYVNIDPKVCTIRDIKEQARRKQRASALDGEEMAILYNGRMVEDDWLVLDCGIQSNGVVQIVRRSEAAHQVKTPIRNKKSYSQNDHQSSAMSISLSSAYLSQEPSFFDDCDSVRDDHQTPAPISQSIVPSTPNNRFQSAHEWESHIRPEENEFGLLLSQYYANIIGDPLSTGSEKSDEEEPSVEIENHLDLLNKYQEVCQARLEVLEKHAVMRQRHQTSEASQDVCRDLRLERNTWRLIFDLLEHSVSNVEEEENGDDENMQEEYSLAFSTEDQMLEHLERKSESLRRNRVVLKWLETVAAEEVEFSNNSRKMNVRTVELLKRSKELYGVVKSVDPDAPVREKASLEADDEEDELELLRGVWGYVRSGKLHEATELCIQLGQPWRAASLSGGNPCGAQDDENETTESHELVRWGNPFYGLWKNICAKLAEKTTPSKARCGTAREYERVIYASLGANLRVLLNSPLCTSWEDHCWVYFKALVEREENEEMLKFQQSIIQRTKHRSGATTTKHMEQFLQRMEFMDGWDSTTVFDELSKSSVNSVRSEAHDLFHLLQSKLVTLQIHEIVTKVLFRHIFQRRWRGDEEELSWDLECYESATQISPSVLRFGAHLVLFFEETGEDFDRDCGYSIILAYIKYLVKHSQLKLIPLYVSKLPQEGIVEVYAQFLEGVEEMKDRKMCLTFAENRFAMHLMPHITKLVVERIIAKAVKFVETGSSHPEEQLSADFTSEDDRFLNSIRWLCFYPSDRGEALVQSNILFQYLILSGKEKVCSLLMDSILPEDSLAIIHEHEQTIPTDLLKKTVKEHLCWKAYLFAEKCYGRWRALVGVPMPQSFSEEQRYTAELVEVVSETSTAIRDVLQFENGWMVGIAMEDDIGQNYSEWTSPVRSSCLPSCVFQLHHLLMESSRKVLEVQYHQHMQSVAVNLLQQSLHVADLVADEQYKIHAAFSKKEMEDAVGLFHRSAMSVLAFNNRISL